MNPSPDSPDFIDGMESPLDLPGLAEHDAAAIDALINAGWNCDSVSESCRPAAQRAVALLSLLDTPCDTSGDGLLADMTLLRIARLEAIGEDATVLCEPDIAAVDALLESRFDVDSVPTPLRDRAARSQQIFELVSPETVSLDAMSPDALIARTLSAVASEARRSESGLRFRPPADTPNIRRFHFSDLLSVAALLLIGAAVVVPVMSGVVETNRRLACSTNLMAAGLAFGQYSKDSRDSLPLASASRAGEPWWFVGRKPEHSNSANAYTVIRTGYAKLDDLACSGNPDAKRGKAPPNAFDWQSFDHVSYSPIVLFGRIDRSATGNAQSVILADRSPVVVRSFHTLTFNPFGSSFNHNERGQNVLMGDGAVVWMRSPVDAQGDNIWLPRCVEDLVARLADPGQADPITGKEVPGSAEDSHVGP
ncbi:MAG: hypothetical protein KF745_03090 [Phycisphaeraceae bacterium]|nr:hypothetical protein [Phycisphaeraceae bacterium]